MTDKPDKPASRLSRRKWLRRAGTLAGVGALTALGIKLSKKETPEERILRIIQGNGKIDFPYVSYGELDFTPDKSGASADGRIRDDEGTLIVPGTFSKGRGDHSLGEELKDWGRFDRDIKNLPKAIKDGLEPTTWDHKDATLVRLAEEKPVDMQFVVSKLAPQTTITTATGNKHTLNAEEVLIYNTSADVTLRVKFSSNLTYTYPPSSSPFIQDPPKITVLNRNVEIDVTALKAQEIAGYNLQLGHLIESIAQGTHSVPVLSKGQWKMERPVITLIISPEQLKDYNTEFTLMGYLESVGDLLYPRMRTAQQIETTGTDLVFKIGNLPECRIPGGTDIGAQIDDPLSNWVARDAQSLIDPVAQAAENAKNAEAMAEHQKNAEVETGEAKAWFEKMLKRKQGEQSQGEKGLE